jgi:IS30 family transposase
MQSNQHKTNNRDAVRRMTEEGYTASQIAVELGITKRTVQRYRQNLGISQPPPVPYSAEERARIRAMLEDGVSVPEIARTIGRSPDVIWRQYRGMSSGSSLCDTIGLRKQLGLLLT